MYKFFVGFLFLFLFFFLSEIKLLVPCLFVFFLLLYFQYLAVNQSTSINLKQLWEDTMPIGLIDDVVGFFQIKFCRHLNAFLKSFFKEKKR